MSVILAIEASQPCGTTYRLAIGCFLPPSLVSVVAALSRLL
ncbi:hypothetical protein [Pelagibius marinus]|nr:hypothetical protein [Pelagibius marinus]